MAGSDGLFGLKVYRKIYGERARHRQEPSSDTGDAAASGRRLSLFLQRNNRRARPSLPNRSSDPRRFISLRRSNKRLSSHYG